MLIFNTLWSVFNEIKTGFMELDPKNMDTESYSPIRAKKFRTRFCGHLFSRHLQNSAYFPSGKDFPTTWGSCEVGKCGLYCGHNKAGNVGCNVGIIKQANGVSCGGTKWVLGAGAGLPLGLTSYKVSGGGVMNHCHSLCKEGLA